MNKPVAWRIGMQTPNDGIKYIYVDSEKDMDFLNRNSPNPYDALYTHPVKELTLTDDEIMDLWNQASSHPAEFAKAILRKAQTK